jgi:hypothetical protein
MAERRTLIEGMKNTPPPIERHREKEFVYGTDPSAEKQAGQVVALSAPDFAEALKRTSLERQLAKVQPNTISDILEVALEPWLKSNGYLP